MAMKIGIDARMYGLAHAGIGRYVKNIVREVVARAKDHDITLFLNKEAFESETFPDEVQTVLADVRHYSVAEQYVMPRLFRAAELDLVHFPHFTVPLLYRKPFVVTIHDILWHTKGGARATTLSPALYYVKYLGYLASVRHAVVDSSAIVTPSAWVRDQLIDHYGSRIENKISVQYEGVDDDLYRAKPDTGVIQKLALTTPFVVYTGSAYPHKNLRRLIVAFSQVHRDMPEAKLVIVSSRSVFLSELKVFVSKLGLTESVVFAGYLSDAELKALYLTAKALVHPSLSEGFGLTGLEALSVGLPVISSDAGSLPEIYGDTVTYIPPESTDAIAQAVLTHLKTEPDRVTMRATYTDMAEKYSWSNSGTELVSLYEQVLA